MPTYSPLRKPALLVGAVTLALVAAIASGCGSESAPSAGEPGALRFRVAWPAAASATGSDAAIRAIPSATERITITVTGAGMAPVSGEVTRSHIVADYAELTLRVPPGSSRTVLVQALDGSSAVVASASVVTNVVAGVTTEVRAELTPVP